MIFPVIPMTRFRRSPSGITSNVSSNRGDDPRLRATINTCGDSQGSSSTRRACASLGSRAYSLSALSQRARTQPASIAWHASSRTTERVLEDLPKIAAERFVVGEASINVGPLTHFCDDLAAPCSAVRRERRQSEIRSTTSNALHVLKPCLAHRIPPLPKTLRTWPHACHKDAMYACGNVNDVV